MFCVFFGPFFVVFLFVHRKLIVLCLFCVWPLLCFLGGNWAYPLQEHPEHILLTKLSNFDEKTAKLLRTRLRRSAYEIQCLAPLSNFLGGFLRAAPGRARAQQTPPMLDSSSTSPPPRATARMSSLRRPTPRRRMPQWVS